MTGHGPGEDVTAALVDAEVAVLVRADGGLVTAAAADGSAVVVAYTAEMYLESAGPLKYEVVPVAELVDRIPEDHHLYLNPTGPVPTAMDVTSLRTAIAEREADGGRAALRPS